MAKGVNKIRDLQFWYPNIPRKLVMAKGISIQAKFVYMYMSCQSATFEFLHEPMAKEMNIGTRTLSKYLNELIDSGWITNGGQKFKNGRKGAVDYIVETSPKKRNTDVQKTACSNTDVSKCDNKYINSSINTPLNNNNSTINSPVNNENIEKGSNEPQSPQSDEEKYFVEKMREMYPRVMRMKQPLTLEQAKKAKDKHGDLVYSILDDMENWSKLYTKVSAYKTLLKWCEKESERL
jgi:hypothetical protein